MSEGVPTAFRQGHCWTNFWEAYQKILPDEQHTVCGKQWATRLDQARKKTGTQYIYLQELNTQPTERRDCSLTI